MPGANDIDYDLLLCYLVGLLHSPEGVNMYVEVGKSMSGLTLWRSTRGSA